MAVFASANYTGTDGTELSAADSNFTRHTSLAVNSVITGNRVASAAAVQSVYWHSADPSSADYDVSGSVYTAISPTGTKSVGVCGRMSTSALTYYLAQYNTSGNVWQLYKCVSGSFTQLGSSVAAGLTAGATKSFKLNMVGTAIKLFKDGEGTAAISVTDSAISATGKIGTRLNGTDLYFDDLSGEEAGGGATTSNGEPGSFSITGVAATGLYNRIATAEPGTFTLTGTAATGLYGRVSTAEPRTFTITGVAAEGVYTPAGAYTSIASPGSFTITGVAATGVYVPLNHYTSNGEAGTFTIAGSNTTVTRTYIVTASPGSFTITGVAATGVYRSNDVIYTASGFSPVAAARTRDALLKVKTRTPVKRIKI